MHRESSSSRIASAGVARRRGGPSSPRKDPRPLCECENRRVDFDIQRAAAEEWHREQSDRLHRRDCLLGSTKGLSPRDRTVTLLMCLGEARRFQAAQVAGSKGASAMSSPTSSLDGLSLAPSTAPHSPTGGRRDWFDVTSPKIYLEVRKDIFLLMQQGHEDPTSPASPKRQPQPSGDPIASKDPYSHTMQELARLRMWNCSPPRDFPAR